MDFSQLYDKYVDVLFNFGCRLTGDREMLKDCIHDVFVKIYTKNRELDDVDNVKSYLLTALRNRINDEFRHNSYMSETAVEDRPMNDVADDAEIKYVENERDSMNNTMISDFMDYLSPRQRQALTLYYIDECKYDDICRIMGINYQSVRNLMHRSLDRLRSIAVNM